MKITWADVAARLKFDERQALLGEYLINRGKDASFELWASEPDDGGPAPIEYAVELASIAPDDPETGPRMVEYLKTKKKRGAPSSYLQLQYETEKPILADLIRLLDPTQAAAFVKLDVGSLVLDLDTGYRPIDEHITARVSLNRHGTPMRDTAPVADGDWPLSSVPLLRIKGVTDDPGVDLAEVCAALSLDTRQGTILKYLVELLQHQCAELWSAVTHDYGLSPLEYLVDLELRANGSGHVPVERPFVEYLRTARALGSDATYFDVQLERERALHHDVSRMVGRDVTAALQALGIGSFLSIATGNEPIAYRLSTLREETRLKRGIDLFCGMPFEYVHIEDSGDVLPCCPSKFRLSIGNLKKDTLHAVWTSRAAEAVRESIEDKSFRFCNYHACEYLKQGRNTHGN